MPNSVFRGMHLYRAVWDKPAYGSLPLVDIPLEIGVLRDGLRFLDQALLATALNNATLVERQGTERALANTTPITG